MQIINLMHIAKYIIFHPTKAYRRLLFACFHEHKLPHDIICTTKGLQLTLRSDSVLAESLFVGAGFEEVETTLLCRLAKPGMNVIDVGANIGLYTVMLGKLVGQTGCVWSFEPFPQSVNYLKKNIELNKLSNVKVMENAVADEDGIRDFFVFPEGCDVYNSLGATIRPEEGLQAIRKIPVAVASLDSIADKVGIETVDLMKVDVEGAEELVLKGARRLIMRSPNIQILLEIYGPSAKQCGCSADRIIQMLKELGFTMFSVASGSMRECNSVNDISGSYVLFKRL